MMCYPVLSDEGDIGDFGYCLNVSEEDRRQHLQDAERGNIYIKYDCGFAVLDGTTPVLTIPNGDLQVATPKRRLGHSIREPTMQQRRLDAAEDRKGKLIIVRAHAADQEVETPADDIWEIVYGKYNSLAKQMDRCSFGNVKYQAWDPEEPVWDCRLPENAKDYTFESLYLAANELCVRPIVGVQTLEAAEHLIVIGPKDMAPKGKSALAVASINFFWSSYRDHDGWALEPSLYMHELGHNRGEGHAKANGEEYGEGAFPVRFLSTMIDAHPSHTDCHQRAE